MDLSRSTDKAIGALFQAFAAPIDHYLAHIGHGTDPLRRRNTGRWPFNGAWSVASALVRLSRHSHPSARLGLLGVLPGAAGRDACGHDAGRDADVREAGIVTTPPLAHEHVVRPAVGMLALFPSYFWHGTVPFTSNQARMTVAFDVVPEP